MMMHNDIYNKIICALLCRGTARDAAEEAGIPEKRLSKIIAEPEFIEAFNDAQEKLLITTTGYLAQHLTQAVKNIVSISNNEEYPVQVRLNAARTILEYTCKFTEISNLFSRIRKIEKANGIEY